MMNHFLRFNMKTLTPIWTGDIDQNAGVELLTTGVMGSLRWWAEALFRGVIAKVPDPTDTHEVYDGKTGENSLSLVNRTFGATGWRRRFRLQIEPIGNSVSPANIGRRIPSLSGERSWFFKSAALQGEFSIRIVPLAPGFKPELIHELFRFISLWGALGARTQMGFGVIQLDPLGQGNTLGNQMQEGFLDGNPDKIIDAEGLPALHNMFFARISPRNGQFSERTTFEIKYNIRNLFRADDDLRHYLMGYVRGNDRKGSQIFVSRPYNNNQEIRLWGWFPRTGAQGAKRAQAYQSIFNYLGTTYKRSQWRELGAKGRDSGDAPTATLDFYRSLLGMPK